MVYCLISRAMTRSGIGITNCHSAPKSPIERFIWLAHQPISHRQEVLFYSMAILFTAFGINPSPPSTHYGDFIFIIDS